MAEALFVPGDRVCNPAAPEWGIGQVQSVVGPRVTVNFEHAGKQLIHTDHASLHPVSEPHDTSAGIWQK